MRVIRINSKRSFKKNLANMLEVAAVTPDNYVFVACRMYEGFGVKSFKGIRVDYWNIIPDNCIYYMPNPYFNE